MTRTSWIGEGWNALVIESESTITLEVMLVEMGAPVLAVITLPRKGTTGAMKVLADVLYADADLFCAAVSGKHVRRRSSRSDRDEGPPV